MPTNRNHRNDPDDITGGRQIISPRDSQSGLPTRQVWDDTDIVHVIDAGEADVAGHTDVNFGDVIMDFPTQTPPTQLIDTSTGEVVWAREGRGQDIEVENDETHVADRPGGARPMMDAFTPKLVRADAAADFEEIAFAVADDPQAMDFTYQKIETFHGVEPGGIDGEGISEANALWDLMDAEVAPEDSLPELDQ